MREMYAKLVEGIPDFYHTFQASNTVEGENWLLTMITISRFSISQTFSTLHHHRHLLKLYTQTLCDPTSTLHLSATTFYLAPLTNLDHFNTKRCPARTATDLLDPASCLTTPPAWSRTSPPCSHTDLNPHHLGPQSTLSAPASPAPIASTS
ncbi:hypothetical protein BC937DRAFT_87047 [Endogone sp. FLAS-F59071]|nr:hypothetical protein BC937DRAFT_87047 [Endogone sp. FLAS-F59071]|eukprot:RUS12786.1 hypothetical protein BC937DRAFT_87047 [Endogone sp. FLAS-F59071]